MNLVQRLLNEIRKQRKRILVIGDALIDVWVCGYIEECQDGCSKFVEVERHTSPGGAANAARSLVNWDVFTSLHSLREEDRPSKCRFVDATGKIVFRWDDESKLIEGYSASQEWERGLALEFVRTAGAVLLSDYNKGFLTPGFIRQVVDFCKRYGIPCIADAKREPMVYAGALLKCNNDYSVKWNCLADVCTDGPNPPLVSGNRLNVCLPPVTCVNHVGAGDCFAAHLAMALAYGFDLVDAVALAHYAGRIYVQRAHNRPPQPDEIAADERS